MWGKRTAALVLCLMMAVLTLPGVALAADPTIVVIGTAEEDDGTPIIYEVSGVAQFSIRINSSAGLTIDKILAGDSKLVSIEYTPADDSGEIVVSPGVTKQITLNCGVSSSLDSGSYSTSIKLYTKDSTTPIATTPIRLYKTTKSSSEVAEEAGETPDPTDSTVALMLSSADANGEIVPAPRGDAGDTIHIRLPILNRSRSKVTKVLVTPQISATLDSFPFVIEAVDYTCKAPDLRAGELAEVDYTFKLSSKVTSGVKEVKFNAVYYNYAKNAYETATFSVFVTVVKGASSTLTDEDGVAITSTPKVIIESYSVKPAKLEDQESGRLFAGEQFEMSFTIRNTSAKEAVQNIQVTLSNEGGAILPANSGSNSLYIDRIAAGDSVEKTMKMQSSPDAEDKAHTLSVKFGYESSETLKTYEATETITLPISQRMRVRVGDPVVYGDAMLEQSTPINFSLYNMGKSSLYNCMVDVEGDGLRMEESYYGGNISAGSEMRADFSIIPSTAGQIEGKVVITYEDVYGQQTRVEKPFTLNVQEAFMPGPEDGKDVFGPGFEEELKPKTPNWLLIVGGVVLVGGVVVLLGALRRKRRKRELEDV